MTDRRRTTVPLEVAVPAAVADGVDFVLVRDAAGDHKSIGELAEALARSIDPAKLIVSGSPPVAKRFGLGLHLRDGQCLPEDYGYMPRVLGRSVHDIPASGNSIASEIATEELAAVSQARYVLAGNVFRTRSHPGRPARGVDWLEAVVQCSSDPVIAIGGITEGNAGSVLRTGCAGIAVIDAILADPDPGAAADRLRTVLDQTHSGSNP
ncbi:MAG TPA: thiamine phosphate synthase [Thermomicrobiales bacterium]|nr:thiamine phosphate synthase [Thermomicrobiales bacterium]